jgi:predicted GNAT family acetyltransferase
MSRRCRNAPRGRNPRQAPTRHPPENPVDTTHPAHPTHPLDRPVWATLVGPHRHLAEGQGLARRYAEDVNLFADTLDDGPQAQSALVALVQPGQTIALLRAAEIAVPAGLRVTRQAPGVQMVATRDLQGEANADEVVDLGEDDAPDMLALARLTEPGPFLARTHAMGGFVGIRRGGRLLAMAGERLRPPGYVEVSGVCTHPDARGQGLARRLSAVVAARIQTRGEQPFLHAWQTNAPAISLYESLGFRLRTRVQVVERL